MAADNVTRIYWWRV